MSPMTSVPTVAQVLQIPATTQLRVPTEFLDENQHMNIQHYFALGASGLNVRCEALGFGPDYIASRQLTIFTAEQHLRYYAELLLGQEISVHVRLLERSAKAVHAMVFLLNRSSESLAFTLEVALVHVGMESRRPVDFPADIAHRLDLALKEQADLDWAAPVCGAMGIRRK